MAIPTTAFQIEMLHHEFMRRMQEPMRLMRELYYPRLFDLIYRRMFLQRPHTDDMMQMCADLGIDVPDRQRISFDGLTFDFRH
jgi:hypothetical protein